MVMREVLMTRTWMVLLACLGAAPAAAARPVLVELYTSEACSSCPPAEALLGELARDPSVIPLAFHVDYWNGPGWRDPYASAAWTVRQRTRASGEIYTPEMVVDGHPGFVGSDQARAADEVARAPTLPVAIGIARQGGFLSVRVGSGAGQGTVRLYGTDRAIRRAIGGGENGGVTLTDYAVVRQGGDLGHWAGGALTLRVAAPASDDAVVVLEGSGGEILGVSRLDLGAP
jgi:hypothetical protein